MFSPWKRTVIKPVCTPHCVAPYFWMTVAVFLSVSLSASDQHWVYSVSLLLFHCQLTPHERRHLHEICPHYSSWVFTLRCARLFMMVVWRHSSSLTLCRCQMRWNSIRVNLTPEAHAVICFKTVSPVVLIVLTEGQRKLFSQHIPFSFFLIL